MPNLPISQLPAAATGYSNSLMVIVNYNTVVTGQTESIPYTAITSGKQDTLVSGSNIKTVNSQSLLGSGNLVINSGRDRIIGSRDDRFTNITSLNFGQILGMTVLDVDIQFQSTVGSVIRLYASPTGTTIGALQIATYTLTADSGRFIRRFFGQIFNEGSYIDIDLRGLNSTYNAISDLPNASSITETIIGDGFSGVIFYPYLVATITTGNFESWVVEYGT